MLNPIANYQIVTNYFHRNEWMNGWLCGSRNFSYFSYHEKFLVLFPHFSLTPSHSRHHFYCISLYCEMIRHRFLAYCQFLKSAHGLNTRFKHFVWSATTNNQPANQRVPNRTNQQVQRRCEQVKPTIPHQISSRWSLIFITCHTAFKSKSIFQSHFLMHWILFIPSERNILF